MAQQAASRAPALPFAVEVTTKTAPVTVHHDLGAGQIRALSGKTDAVGLTRTILTTATRLETTFLSTTSGERGFWVSGVDVALWYRSIDIYVAREHPKDGCEYQAILDHENEHVRVDRELVEEYAGKFKAALLSASFPTKGNPLRVDSAAEGKRQADARLREILEPLQAELKRKRRQVSDALDTPEIYEQVGRRCSQR